MLTGAQYGLAFKVIRFSKRNEGRRKAAVTARQKVERMRV